MRFGTATAIAALAVTLTLASGASADFVNGQVINGRFFDPNINTPLNDPLYDFTTTLAAGSDFTSGYVDAGWRFDFVGDRFRIDFFTTASYFYFDLTKGRTFVGYVLSDLGGTIPSFTGASVVATNSGNWANVLTVVDANTMHLNFVQLGPHNFYDGDFVEFQVQFVPAPGAMALLAVGGLSFRRRAR